MSHLTTLTPNLSHQYQYFLTSTFSFFGQLFKASQLLFLLTHFLFSFSGCLSARGVWGQKGLLAPVGLLRWLALPSTPSACNSMVCPTHLSSCMDFKSSVPLFFLFFFYLSLTWSVYGGVLMFNQKRPSRDVYTSSQYAASCSRCAACRLSVQRSTSNR